MVEEVVKECVSEMKGEMPMRYWFYGPTGSKKTYTAWKIAGALGERPYLKSCGKVWDNYKGQKIVLIDDVDGDHMKYLLMYLNKWMDYYDFQGWETRQEGEEEESGNVVKSYREKTIDASKYHLIITSRYPPEINKEELEEKFRRIFKVVEFK